MKEVTELGFSDTTGNSVISPVLQFKIDTTDFVCPKRIKILALMDVILYSYLPG